jgi:hypothetical protein
VVQTGTEFDSADMIGALEKVWTPVKVWAASDRAKVAEVDGKVIVWADVKLNVCAAFQVRFVELATPLPPLAGAIGEPVRPVDVTWANAPAGARSSAAETTRAIRRFIGSQPR